MIQPKIHNNMIFLRVK